MEGKRIRNCCFTINNYSKACEILLGSLFQEKAKYLIYGYEKGESGTPHLQGYVELKQQVSFETLKKYMPKAHIELRKGTPKQASEYCMKEGDFKEFGEISNQGKRTDLDSIAEDLIQNKSVRDIALEYPVSFIKFHRGIKELRNQVSSVRNWKPEVFWVHGKTGTGKTKYFYDHFDDDRWVWTPHMGTWFDGYDGQSNVLFDDYRGEFTFGMLLSLLDRYECKVQVKGGMVQFTPRFIVITSPRLPEEIYCPTAQGDSINQLLRRIDKTIEKK